MFDLTKLRDQEGNQKHGRKNCLFDNHRFIEKLVSRRNEKRFRPVESKANLNFLGAKNRRNGRLANLRDVQDYFQKTFGKFEEIVKLQSPIENSRNETSTLQSDIHTLIYIAFSNKNNETK